VNTIEPFFGSDKSRGSYEALALKYSTSSVMKQEADLYRTKWFEYRMWHPVRATYYWANCYVEASRRFCAQNFDVEKAKTAKIISHEDIFQTRDAAAATIARQALDRIGCRYEWAMFFMTKRFSDRGWFAMPRPNQLYGEELTLDIADAWALECNASLQFPKDTAFQARDGKLQTPVQSEYVDWVVQQVRARGTDQWRSVSRLLSEGILTQTLAEHHFGPDTTRRAARALGIDR
jgi:hypothetical protein